MKARGRRPLFPGAVPSACGFLSQGELEGLLDSSGPRERRREFEEHLESGCEECLYLVADLDVFRDLLEKGVRRAEQLTFERGAPVLEKRLTRLVARGRADAPRSWVPAAALLAACLLAAMSLTVVLQGQGAGASDIRLPDGSGLAVEAMAFASPPTLRGEQHPARGWRAAGNAYRGGNYREASRLLAMLGAESPQGADALLYRGICELRLGEYKRATDLLVRARDRARREELPEGAAAWFQGLAQLALGDVPEARKALEASRDAGGLFAPQAAALLTRLDESE